jgi:hypothetical protein
VTTQNKKIKIGIVGAGTSGAISLLSILDDLYKNKAMHSFEIHLFFDSNKPKLKVGEGLSPLVTSLLVNTLGYEYDETNLKFNETKRYGAYSHWEKATGKDFYVKYPHWALHVDAGLFSEWVIENAEKKFNNVFVIDTEVIDIKSTSESAIIACSDKNYTLDFVIDCRGTPTKEELNSGNYFKPEFESVNSVLIYPQFEKIDEKYTQVYLHDDGWMFGIPVAHRKAFGYLYNNKLLSEENAIEKICDIKNITPDKIAVNINWQQYYRLFAMEERILYIGNKLYFFEPHNAMPLHYYHILVNTFMIILLRTQNISETVLYVNSYHARQIEHIKAMIALNYVGRMDLDTEFWNVTSKKAKEYLYTNDYFINWCKTVTQNNEFSGFGFMGVDVMKQYVEGYQIDLTQFVSNKPTF